MSPLGRHVLMEFPGCDPARIGDVALVTRAMLQAAEAGGATIVSHHFHQFSPLGVSGVVIISESHLAIHTWPEHRFAAVDLFTCVERVSAERIQASLQEALGAEDPSVLRLERGPLRILRDDDGTALVGQQGLLDGGTRGVPGP